MKQLKLRRYLIALLIVLSLVLTTGTFAYWFNEVSGSNTVVEDTLTIGYGETVQTQLSIDLDNIDDYGELVPSNQVVNSRGNSVDFIPLNYQIKWQEQNSTSQVQGEDTYGIIKTYISYDIIPQNQETILDKETNSSIYSLVNIEASVLNTKEILLNDDTPKHLQFVVTLDEPSNKTEYQIIKNATIHFYFTFEVVLNDYELNLDFVSMSMDDLLDVSLQAKSQAWETEVNEPLNSYVGEQRIFFPISSDEYTLTVKGNLTKENSSGGYGIMFDTTFINDNVDADTGYILQFDRGYAHGELIIRPRSGGNEYHPVWGVNHNDGFFPSEYDSPEWWTDIHEITIAVSRIDSDTKEASFYLDGVFIGTFEYESSKSDQQTYVGLRGWSWTSNDFYSLQVK